MEYLCYLYQDRNTEFNIEIFYTKTVSFDYLLDSAKIYIEELAKSEKFTTLNIYSYFSQIFKDTITTEEQYNQLHDTSKKIYNDLVYSEDDPLFYLMPEEVKNKLTIFKEVKEKNENIKILKSKKVKDCIKDFFNKKQILEDIKQIKKYFPTSTTTTTESFDYEDIFFHSDYEKNKEFLEKEIIILNPFLYNYLRYMNYRYYRQSDIDIANILGELEKNWDKNWGLYLYDYLVSIKLYGNEHYNFLESQIEKLKNYFNDSQITNIEFQIHTYWHIKTVFGFDIELKENTIINMMKVNYGQLLDNHPSRVFYRLDGMISNKLDFENKDFSNFISKYNIDKKWLLDELIDSINMENSCFYTGNYYSDYYNLLSIINIYNILDEKDYYTDKIKKIILEYFEYTLKNSGKILFLSELIIDTVSKLELINDVLSKILDHSTIQDCHLRYIDDIQRKYYNINEQKENYNLKLKIDIVYQIRCKIEDNKKIVIKYESTSQTPHSFNSDESKKIDDLKNIIEKIQNSNYLIEINEGIKFTEIISYFKKSIDNNPLYTNYDLDNNTIYLLYFIDKDIKIWEKFCAKALKYKNSIYEYNVEHALSYAINNYENINMIEFTKIIKNLYPTLPPPKEYPIGTSYIREFGLINIFNECIEYIIETEFVYDYEAYDNLLSIKQLNKNTKYRIEYKKDRLFEPKKIIKYENNFTIENEGGRKEDFERIDKLIEYIEKRVAEKGYISKIIKYEYLIKDIEHKTFTLSHPYMFEDDIENQFPIDNSLFISCWSYTIEKENAYAWWKLYGSKEHFRVIVPIKNLYIN